MRYEALFLFVFSIFIIEPRFNISHTLLKNIYTIQKIQCIITYIYTSLSIYHSFIKDVSLSISFEIGPWVKHSFSNKPYVLPKVILKNMKKINLLQRKEKDKQVKLL